VTPAAAAPPAPAPQAEEEPIAGLHIITSPISARSIARRIRKPRHRDVEDRRLEGKVLCLIEA